MIVSLSLEEMETVVGDLLEEVRAYWGYGGMARMPDITRRRYEAGVQLLERARRQSPLTDELTDA